MMKLAVCLVVIIAGAYAAETNVHFTDCNNKEVKSFYVSGCSMDQNTCVIHKNQNVDIIVGFTANQDTGKSLKTRFLANMNGLEIGWPGIDGMDPCQKGSLQCPLKKGTDYQFKMNFKLDNLIPNVNVKATFKIMNGNKVMACAKVPIKVTN